MKLLGFALLVVFSVPAGGQTPLVSQVSEAPGAFKRVDRIGEATARSFFIFATSDHNYAIRHDGNSESSTATGLRRSFHLPIGSAERIDRFSFCEYEQDLLLLYSVTDGRSSWGYLVRLDQIKRRIRWSIPLETSSVATAIVETDFAYVAAANLIAKVDLRLGRFVWENRDVGKHYTPMFEEFEQPVVTADRVLLREIKEQGRTIEVDKSSGDILAVRDSAAVPKKLKNH